MCHAHTKLKQEVNFLRGRDSGKGMIDFVDIASPSYSAADNYGIDYDRVRVERGKWCGDATQSIDSDQKLLVPYLIFCRCELAM